MNMREARLQAGIQQLAGRCQGDRARTTLEQLQTKQLFKSTNLVAQRARGNAQFLRGLAHAEMSRRAFERAQGIERRDRIHENSSTVN